jgi:uncharacterized membrane protein YhaH (DUF805 family)
VCWWGLFLVLLTVWFSEATSASIAVATRRLHDVNRSGWWQLIAITLIGLIPLIYWLAQPAETTENRFGKNPLAG